MNSNSSKKDVKNGNPKDYVNDVSFMQVYEDPIDGILSCGFLHKKPEKRLHKFIYYGGFIILSGKGTYINEEGMETPIGPGDFIQRQPGVAHTTTVEQGQPWLEFYVCFGPKLYKTLVDMSLISDQPILHTRMNQETKKNCEMLLYNFKNGTDKDLPNLLLQVQSFMFYMNALHHEEGHAGGLRQIIEQLCESLGTDFESRMDIKALAQKHQMGHENMRKLFKKQMGTSIYQYRIFKRINEGKRLLCYKDLSIKEIAMRLGYTDQYAFSNQFKKVTGFSPLQFRKNL